MTTGDELTVYGKRTGSLWDRRIGGRYELTEISDTGGTGMWVTLRRLGNGHELAMSVHYLGRNFVCVPEKAEPAEDERWSDKAEPAATQTSGYVSNLTFGAPEPIEPSVDIPLAAWEIEHLVGEPWGLHFGDLVHIGEPLYRVVDADGTAILEPEPAPSPPLPWKSNPGWYRGKRGSVDEGYAYDLGADDRLPTDGATGNAYERVAVIPRLLIEKLRAEFAEDVLRGNSWTGPETAALALLDAADGAS